MLQNLPEGLPEYKGNGKILRIKEGYNPNSSSLGSIVFSFPAALLAVPVLFSAAAALIATKFIGRQNEETDSNKDGE